jgi:hypothetical protein
VVPPDQPSADDPLAGLRRLAGLAKDLGVSDVGSFVDMLERARNEGRGAELFNSLKSLIVEQFSGPGENKSLSDLGARLTSLVTDDQDLSEEQSRTRAALLRRIEDLSRTADVEGVANLATAYAQVCSARVAAPKRPS